MSNEISSFVFQNISVKYILNDEKRAVLILCPSNKLCDLNSEKNKKAYNCSSFVHLKLSDDDAGIFSNSFRLSDTVHNLKFSNQDVIENGESITVITTETSKYGYGIHHHLKWYKNENGFEVCTEFFNNSGKDLRLEYLTSVSLDALSPYLLDGGSKDLIFHRFKAGWSMEGLLQSDDLCYLGLEKAWNFSGECLKLGAIGSRPVREYHPYAAIEDKKNDVIWGMYLAHNASWQMELARVSDSVSLSIGLADSMFGAWSKSIKNGCSFKSPTAMISVSCGGISELSDKILSMRHRAIDQYGENGVPIAYNEFAATWGNPNQDFLFKIANVLKQGKTKYFIVDAGWYFPNDVGDWEVNNHTFPNGMKYFCDVIRSMGMIPGIWMEFECTGVGAKAFGKDFKSMKLTRDGRIIVGHVINGRKEDFLDFRKEEVISYLDKKVISFLKENGFGYIKVDYNASIGIGVDGEDSIGENLRKNMEDVRNFFLKIKREIPDIIIENCASGGCRLEPSMMDITAISSASDTHDVYEAAVVGANLHYLTPPRQNSIWATLRPEFSKERFSYVISQGFLGRLCWSGRIDKLSKEQLNDMFSAEVYYEKVSPVIMHGKSYIFRTDECSIYDPVGTQVVLRYSEDERKALVVIHYFKNTKELSIDLKGEYIIESSLYDGEVTLADNRLIVPKSKCYSGNVYLLKKL